MHLPQDQAWKWTTFKTHFVRFISLFKPGAVTKYEGPRWKINQRKYNFVFTKVSRILYNDKTQDQSIAREAGKTTVVRSEPSSLGSAELRKREHENKTGGNWGKEGIPF